MQGSNAARRANGSAAKSLGRVVEYGETLPVTRHIRSCRIPLCAQQCRGTGCRQRTRIPLGTDCSIRRVRTDKASRYVGLLEPVISWGSTLQISDAVRRSPLAGLLRGVKFGNDLHADHRRPSCHGRYALCAGIAVSCGDSCGDGR